MMVKKIIKRNGAEVEFDAQKIITAIKKANCEVTDAEKLTDEQIKTIEKFVENKLNQIPHTPSIEDIQIAVIHGIMEQQAYEVARLYTEYRYKRQLIRQANTTDDAILALLQLQNEEINQENSNKNPVLLSTQRDYIAGEVNKDLLMRIDFENDATEYFPDRPLKRVKDAHKSGRGHFHDSDYSKQQYHNCDLLNIDDMLSNGTVISNVKIFPPRSLLTAMNIGAQIIAQCASSQYGGQTVTLSHFAKFVDISRQKYKKKIKAEGKASGINYTDEQLAIITEMRVKDEVTAAIQTFQHQLITLMTTNGQTPFVSVFMWINEVPEGQIRKDLAMLIEEMLKQRIKGLPNEQGVFVTPAFPKLLYCLDDNNTYEGSEYYYLTELAAECSIKRMVPDYISAKKMREYKGDVYPCMGCRSFLTPDRFTDKNIGNIANAQNYVEGEHKYYGRFNMGVYTINLVDVACSSNKDENKFWEILEDRLENEAHVALRWRYEHLKGTKTAVAPILWNYGALARLGKDETIDKLLINGYATLSLGYAGLYEMTYYMKGCSHTDPNGKDFALAVMQKLNDKCSEWKADENIDYSLYGTPLESTTYKFAKTLQANFGIIENVTDHNYITNSYHVNVREKIDAFEKLAFEAEFQKLSPGGAISYVETPNMSDNPEAVMKIIQFIYENIQYAEINSKSDYCEECGFDGEIEIYEDKNGKLGWKCPNCGNTDQTKMSVARRTCGYIGTQFWNQGRTQEIRDRELHVSIETENI